MNDDGCGWYLTRILFFTTHPTDRQTKCKLTHTTRTDMYTSTQHRHTRDVQIYRSGQKRCGGGGGDHGPCNIRKTLLIFDQLLILYASTTLHSLIMMVRILTHNQVSCLYAHADLFAFVWLCNFDLFCTCTCFFEGP